MKLRTRLFLIITVIAIIPQTILTVALVYRHAQINNGRTTEVIDQQFNAVAASVEYGYDSFQYAMNVVLFYSNDGSSVAQLMADIVEAEGKGINYNYYIYAWRIQSIFQNICYSFKSVEGIYVMLPMGKLIGYRPGDVSSMPDSYGGEDAQWYDQTIDLNGRILYSSADRNTTFQLGAGNVVISQAVYDIYTHEPVGVILLDCNPEYFWAPLAESMADMTAFTLYNPKTDSVLWSNVNPDVRFEKDGDIQQLSRTVTDIHLELTMNVDYGAFSREMAHSLTMLVVLCFVCEIAIIFLVWYFSGKFIRPIEQMGQHVMRQKGMQLVPFEAYLNRRDEIGILVRVYNEMAEKLNAAIREEYENNLMILDAQMRALESNINAHFLFNTLESINSMAELDGNDDIVTMSLALGNMFRYAIKTEREKVALAEELQHVLDYVSIQQIRFDNRFRLVMDVPEELKDQKVLKLILQPLVENALKHGLNYCVSGNEISISARMQGQCLKIVVSDNGQGIEPDRLAQIRSRLNEAASFIELGHRACQSIGLKNIQTRIELYYGKGYGMTVNSQINHGTEIILLIPVYEGGK